MKNDNTTRCILRYVIPGALLLVAAIFIVVGILDKEAGSVLKKATAICMECIGLG